MPFETVESIIEQTDPVALNKEPINTIHPEAANHAQQTAMFIGLLDTAEKTIPLNERMRHPRDVERQAKVIAALPSFIIDYMKEYKKLTYANNEFYYGRHNS